MKKVSTRIVAIFLTATQLNFAHALIDVPTFRFALGPSTTKFTAGSDYPNPTSLSSIVAINPMFLWDIPGARMRLGAHFLADLGSRFGFITSAGIGVTSIYYPMGLSSSREVRDDFSEVVKTRISPFLQFALTPMKFTITNPDVAPDTSQSATNKHYFSSRVLEISFGAGVDYPIANDLILFGGLHYRAAAYKAEESGQGAVSYSGISLLFGLMTNFY